MLQNTQLCSMVSIAFVFEQLSTKLRNRVKLYWPFAGGKGASGNGSGRMNQTLFARAQPRRFPKICQNLASHGWIGCEQVANISRKNENKNLFRAYSGANKFREDDQMGRFLAIIGSAAVAFCLLTLAASARPVRQDDEAKKAEAAAYKAFYDASTAKDYAKAVPLAKSYLEKFPSGQYSKYFNDWLGSYPILRVQISVAVQEKNKPETLRL